VYIKKTEIESPASTGGQGKYTKYVTFPWPPVETTLCMFNVRIFVKKQSFERKSIKTKYVAPSAE
jgi:hypothetical protein